MPLLPLLEKILRGFRREETARFVAMRSHWNFEASFCTPGEGHEKDGVEGEVGTFRRNQFLPVPGCRVMDLGCNIGYLTTWLAVQEPDREVVGSILLPRASTWLAK